MAVDSSSGEHLIEQDTGGSGSSSTESDDALDGDAVSRPREELKTSFLKRRPFHAIVRELTTKLPRPDGNTDANKDYTEVFLCHARVFVFADQWDILILREMALDKLHQGLAGFSLHQKRLGDIVMLLQYIYHRAGESGQRFQDIRTLLTHHIGWQMDTLLMNGSSRKGLVEHEALMEDFLEVVASRIR